LSLIIIRHVYHAILDTTDPTVFLLDTTSQSAILAVTGIEAALGNDQRNKHLEQEALRQREAELAFQQFFANKASEAARKIARQKARLDSAKVVQRYFF
jgi:hypothetical protein